MHEKTFHFLMTFHKLIDNTPLHNIHWQRVLNTKPKIKRIQALLNSYFKKLWANKSCFVILIFYRLKSRPTFHYVLVLSDCVFFCKNKTFIFIFGLLFWNTTRFDTQKSNYPSHHFLQITRERRGALWSGMCVKELDASHRYLT